MGNNGRTDIKVDTNIKVSHILLQREHLYPQVIRRMIFEYKHNKKDKPHQKLNQMNLY